ncbi:MAG: ComEC/Rec2 family competence protein [Planctomycetota bacterium]|nr:MAG: ComEC/Rec2 family competence protein [Planctomycetota bacterium]
MQFFSRALRAYRNVQRFSQQYVERVADSDRPNIPMVVVAMSLCCGVLVGRIVLLPWGVWWLMATGALGLWYGVFQQRRNHHEVALLLVSIGCMGAAWDVMRWRLFETNDIGWMASDTPSPIAIEARVRTAPRNLPTNQNDPLSGEGMRDSSDMLVEVIKVRHKNQWIDSAGRATVIVNGQKPAVEVGSLIQIFGRILQPQEVFNPGEYNFRERARTQRSLAIVRCHAASCIVEKQSASFWTLAGMLEKVRRWGTSVINQHVALDRAPLASALLLGSRESIPREDTEVFLVTGTIHILSISGLHVGILACALFRLFQMGALPRTGALAAVSLCTGAYMLLVGAEPPVIRATLLVWIACLGAFLGRRPLGANSLAIAVVIVVLWHPPELFRISTQLSFLSTGILIAAATAIRAGQKEPDPLLQLIERSHSYGWRWMRKMFRSGIEIVAMGACIWVAAAPMVALLFHVVSPIGLLLNPLIAPFVALAMGFGFICLLLTPLSTSLAGLFGWLCEASLDVVERTVSVAANIPGAYMWTSGPSAWWVIGWYLLVGFLAWRISTKFLGNVKYLSVTLVAWIVVGFAIDGMGDSLSKLRHGEPIMHAIVASMGHGCGICIETPQGRCLVYDAGRLGAPGAAKRAMCAVLWSRGIRRIDHLVVSHADTDHFNAVPEIVERFDVRQLVVSHQMLSSESAAVKKLLEHASEHRIEVRAVRFGDVLRLDSMTVANVLHPLPTFSSEMIQSNDPQSPQTYRRKSSDNEESLVLSIESCSRRLLLTGDLEGPAVHSVLARLPTSCDVLLAPHHGSRTSLPPLLAEHSVPKWVVVSGVGGATWNEVFDAYSRTGANVVKTGDEGALEIAFERSGIFLRRYGRSGWKNLMPDPLKSVPTAYRDAPDESIATRSGSEG